MERISNEELPDGLMQTMRQVQVYIDNAGLDYKLLVLLRMRVSQINSCAYCIDMHFKEGVHAGETPQRLVSVSAWRETPYYSPREQAVLAFAETLTRMREEEHSDDIHGELSKYFSKHDIAKLTLAVTQINTWNRLMRSFGRVPGSFKVAAKQAAAQNG